MVRAVNVKLGNKRRVLEWKDKNTGRVLGQEELGTWKKRRDGRSYDEDVQTNVSRKKNNVREERMREGMSGEGGIVQKE